MAQESKQRDFFISYNQADLAWAEWIAWQLENEGYSTILRAWDFRPGSNFVIEMDNATKHCKRTIAILSPSYLVSLSTQPEWATAFAQDPTGKQSKLLPVRVYKCDVKGLLNQIVSIDLVDLDVEEARNALRAGISRSRVLPMVEPLFPGKVSSSLFPVPSFPGRWPEIWQVPYQRNTFFTGRNAFLTRLRAQLRAGETTARSQSLAVSGLGGIGKTQIALEYAYRYRQDYRAVLWVQADTRESLTTSYLKLAHDLDLPEKDVSETEQVIDAVKRWLQTMTDYLLILDSADDLELARDFLPPSWGGHLLLTTCAHATGGFAYCKEVETLSQDEGAYFLLRRAKVLAAGAPFEQASRDDQTLGRAICNELGGLPLALDQVGAYVEETQCGLSQYFQRYEKLRASLLKRRGYLSADDHPQPVATTWSLSFQKVEEKNPMASDLLRLCAFLAPDAIPEEIITKGAPWLGPLLEPVATNEYLLDEAIGMLLRYSLVNRSFKEKSLSVHHLVQVVLQDSLTHECRQHWEERAVVAVNAAFPDVAYESWPLCERLLGNALVIAKLIEQKTFSSSEAVRLLQRTGDYLREHARYTEALPLYDLCLTIRKRNLGNGHPDLVQSFSNLANLSSELGQYDKAVPQYQESLQIGERIWGNDHLSVAYPRNNLAIVYKVQAKYEEAEELHERNLLIWKQNRGSDSPDFARLLNNLGVLYGEQGKYKKAEALFRRSQSILERSLGNGHPDLAQCLSNLANLSVEQDKYAEATSLYKQSLDILEQNLRLKHSDAAYPLNGLGILLMKQRHYADAKRTFTRCRDIWELILGQDHPQVAYALHNLAVLVVKQGRDENTEEWDKEAEDLFTHNLDIWSKKLGSQGRNNVHTKRCAMNYAILLHILQRDDEARRLAKEYNFTNDSLNEDQLLAISTFRSFRLYGKI